MIDQLRQSFASKSLKPRFLGIQNNFFRNRFDEALECIFVISYDKVIPFNPSNANSWENKAKFFIEYNKLDKALEWLFLNNIIFHSFNQALKLEP